MAAAGHQGAPAVVWDARPASASRRGPMHFYTVRLRVLRPGAKQP